VINRAPTTLRSLQHQFRCRVTSFTLGIAPTGAVISILGVAVARKEHCGGRYANLVSLNVFSALKIFVGADFPVEALSGGTLVRIATAEQILAASYVSCRKDEAY